MAKSITSKGQIITKESNESEDYICRLTLSKSGLLIEREEYLKENICLYDIPLNRITEINYLNKKQQKKSFLKSCWTSFIGVLPLVLSGIGFIYREPKVADILKISFRDKDGKEKDLVFDMMRFGECGLAKYYKKLVNN